MNDTEKEMRDAFISILTKGRKYNTYKFALARYLLYHARYKKTRDIPYRNIASAFLQYYWHQERRYKVRQSSHTRKTPHVVNIIRDVFGTDYAPHPFKKEDQDKIKTAENRILKKVFGHAKYKTSLVIPKFQNIPTGNTVTANQIFYDYDDDEQRITLKPSVVEFFNKHYTVLFKSVILEWAKYLEQVNYLPYLIAKIERDQRVRRSLTQYTRIFKDFKSCFYCDVGLRPEITTVDHFIPWSYVFEDEAWNLVLSCRECNCKKSDSLPQRKFLDDLIGRNCDWYNKIPTLKRSLDSLDYGKSWEYEIKHHYTNCKDYGFGLTVMP